MHDITFSVGSSIGQPVQKPKSSVAAAAALLSAPAAPGFISKDISCRWLSDASFSEVRTTNLGSITVYADLVEIRSPRRSASFGSGGRRGACMGFSARSRRRLMRALARVRSAPYIYFVTLTYPGSYSSDWRAWKRDLFAWRKRLARRWPQFAGGAWRVEFQKRGAPHYHLLLFSAEELPLHAFRSWLSQSWYEVVGSADERHLRAGTQALLMDSRRAIRSYVSKYVAKLPADDDSQPDGWGRNWGFFGQVDDSPYLTAELSHQEYVTLRRLIRRLMRARTSPRFARYLRSAEVFSVYRLGVESSAGPAPPLIGRLLDLLLSG